MRFVTECVVLLCVVAASADAFGQASETCPGEPVDITALTSCSDEGVTLSGSTRDAADDIDESVEVPCWGDGDGGGDDEEHVYQITLTADRRLQIDLNGSHYDTQMAIVSS